MAARCQVQSQAPVQRAVALAVSFRSGQWPSQETCFREFLASGLACRLHTTEGGRNSRWKCWFSTAKSQRKEPCHRTRLSWSRASISGRPGPLYASTVRQRFGDRRNWGCLPVRFARVPQLQRSFGTKRCYAMPEVVTAYLVLAVLVANPSIC